MKSPGHSDYCRCAQCLHTEGRIPLLSLRGVNFIRECRPILQDINFTVDRGDFIAITGPNGGGKTSLLRLILGLLKPDSGQIVYYGIDGNVMPASLFRPGYLPQKSSVDDHFPITVREVIASGLLGVKNLDKTEKEVRIEEALDLTELRHLSSRPIGRLSGGQLQRALFGRAIVARPSVLILDEPLSYLDAKYSEHLHNIVWHLSDHATILLVSHQMSEIAGMANRHIIVDHTLHECAREHHYFPPECK